MGVEKMSVSFGLELGEAIRASAAGSGKSVSGWLAEAARSRLRSEALGAAVQAWENQYGALTEAEVADAEQALAAAARQPRSGAA
ncbi:MAG: hypothetical protein ACRD2W_02895 [Acidimicrobiales bacterium]